MNEAVTQTVPETGETETESLHSLKKPQPREGFWAKFRRFLRVRWYYWVILGLVLVVMLIILWMRIIVFIESGQGGVLYRPLQGGTVTERIYTEGIHFLLPINTMTIYNTRVQVILHEFSVLTAQGLPVTLKLAVRYRPIFELLGVLHQQVGPDYPNKIILTQIESVLRKGLGTETPEAIYTNENLLLNKLISRAIEEVGRRFIIVDDIIIRSVSLPPDVTHSIEAKLVEEQKYLAYAFRLKLEEEEAKRKLIEANGIKEYARNIAETMNSNVLHWHGIQATLELARSQNSKVIVIGGGGGKSTLPIILDATTDPLPVPQAQSPDKANDQTAKPGTLQKNQASGIEYNYANVPPPAPAKPPPIPK